MNKKKINKIIAYTTLCCTLSSNISTFVYAHNNVDVNNKKNMTSLDATVTFKENVVEDSSSEHKQDSIIQFSDKKFEAMIREALELKSDTPIYKSTLDKVDSLIFSITDNDNNIESLDDITKLTNLTKVTIYNKTSNVDLSPLKLLNSLTTVTLGNGTYDLSQLPENNIIELGLVNATITNSKLDAFTKLETFEYTANDNNFDVNFDFVDNLKNINTLVNLKITTSKAANTQCNKLSELTKLEKLEFINNNDESIDLNFLSSLTKLKQVSLYKCNPNSISVVNDLKVLERIEIHNSGLADNHLTSIDETLNRVTVADLSGNKLTKVNNLNTIFKDKEITLKDNFIDLSLADNKEFLDSKDADKMYPQKKLALKNSENNFVINVNSAFDINNLVIQSINKSGSLSTSEVASDDITYYIDDKDKEFLKVDSDNKLVATKEGNAIVQIGIKGTDKSSTTITTTISSIKNKEAQAVVIINTVDENNKSIGNTQVPKTYDIGTQRIVVPYVEHYYPLEGENIYKDVTLTSGNISKITFKYKKISEDKTNKGKIQIVYRDDAGKEISDTEFKEQLSLSAHNINAKEIQGYTLTSNNVETVTLTENEPYKVVTFTYKKDKAQIQQGSITIKYVEQGTNKVLLQNKVINGLDLKAHEVIAEEISGYKVIGNSKITVTLTDNKPSEEVVFTYKKVDGNSNGGNNSQNNNTQAKKGTVTIYYVDSESNIELANKEVKTDLELKEQIFTAKQIPGFTAITDTLKVALSENITSGEITFKYTNKIESADSSIFTLTPSLLRKYVDNKYNWNITSKQGELDVPNTVLSKILAKTSDNINISFNNNLFDKDAYTTATKKYDVNVLTTISISNNIPTLEDNINVNLSTKVPSSYSNKDLYLYKVMKDGNLSFVDKKKASNIDDNNVFVAFAVDINKLKESDFIVSNSDLKLANNSEANGTQSGNNGNKDENDKNNLPDTSGSAGVLLGLSITSLLAGVGLRRKK